MVSSASARFPRPRILNPRARRLRPAGLPCRRPPACQGFGVAPGSVSSRCVSKGAGTVDGRGSVPRPRPAAGPREGDGAPVFLVLETLLDGRGDTCVSSAPLVFRRNLSLRLAGGRVAALVSSSTYGAASGSGVLLRLPTAIGRNRRLARTALATRPMGMCSFLRSSTGAGGADESLAPLAAPGGGTRR